MMLGSGFWDFLFEGLGSFDCLILCLAVRVWLLEKGAGGWLWTAAWVVLIWD